MIHTIKCVIAFCLAAICLTSTAQTHRTASGIVVMGSGRNIRAMGTFSGLPERGTDYALAVNRYYTTLQGRVNVYCMVIPTAIEMYGDEQTEAWSKPQQPAIEHIYSQLLPEVKGIPVRDTLMAHRDEPICMRTDHHWAPLGGFYAARTFAQVAGVPFKGLEHYDTCVVSGFVGTMAKWSKDQRVGRFPEKFVYYTPRDTDYVTTAVTYTLDKSRRNVVAQVGPQEVNFFRKYKDGSGHAYSTFMGGDSNNTRVRAFGPAPRRLLILKDSYGNALPGYLFYSFEEVHVIDCRYFTGNIVDYINGHAVTDILFANNIVHAYTAATARMYNHYLEQR